MINETADSSETDPDNYTGPPKVDKKTGKSKCKNGKEPDEDGKCLKDADFHNASPPKDPLHQESLDIERGLMDELFDDTELDSIKVEATEKGTPSTDKTPLLPKKVKNMVVYNFKKEKVGTFNDTANGAAKAFKLAGEQGGKAVHENGTTSVEITPQYIIELYLKEKNSSVSTPIIESRNNYTNEVNLVNEINSVYSTPVLSDEYLALGLVNEKPKPTSPIKEQLSMSSSMNIYYASLDESTEKVSRPLNIGKPFKRVNEDKPESETQCEKLIKGMISNKIVIW